MRYLLKNGTVVSGEKSMKADVLTDGEKILAVGEKLPEDGTYLTTLNGELVGQKEPFTGMCGIENGKWDEEGCVIAWMPLPEPYREKEKPAAGVGWKGHYRGRFEKIE